MSHNPFLLETNIAKYFAQLLNISLDDDLSMMDMVEDLNSIENLADFRVFVKEKFNYERFRYLTGYQKFIALVNEYKKDNAPTLTVENAEKADNYSENLFRKITTILDEVNFAMQTMGKGIEDFNYEQTLLKNGLKDHHMKVLNEIGDKKKIMHLAVYGKEELRSRIEKIVNKKTLEKQCPQLAISNKKNFEGAAVIERLKLGVKHG